MIQLFLIILMVSVNIFIFNDLPPQIPTHWNIYGQIDQYMAKSIGIWIMPAVSTAMIILFKFLPSLDPKKEKYKLFQKEWNIIQTAVLAFLVYTHLLMLYFALHPSTNFLTAFFLGLGVYFILIGNYMSKIRQNYFIGVRTPWTLNDEDNWNKTQRCASWCFVITGIVIIIEAFTLWVPSFIVIGLILLAALVPIVYSFLLFKNKSK